MTYSPRQVVSKTFSRLGLYIDLARPKSGAPQSFIWMLLKVKIIQLVRQILYDFVVSLSVGSHGGVLNGLIEFKIARKIWPLLELLAKIR